MLNRVKFSSTALSQTQFKSTQLSAARRVNNPIDCQTLFLIRTSTAHRLPTAQWPQTNQPSFPPPLQHNYRCNCQHLSIALFVRLFTPFAVQKSLPHRFYVKRCPRQIADFVAKSTNNDNTNAQKRLCQQFSIG